MSSLFKITSRRRPRYKTPPLFFFFFFLRLYLKRTSSYIPVYTVCTRSARRLAPTGVSRVLQPLRQNHNPRANCHYRGLPHNQPRGDGLHACTDPNENIREQTARVYGSTSLPFSTKFWRRFLKKGQSCCTFNCKDWETVEREWQDGCPEF